MTYYVQCYRGKIRINLHIVGNKDDIECHLLSKGYDKISFVPTLFRG